MPKGNFPPDIAMKYSELNGKTLAELEALLLGKYKEQFALRLKQKTDQLKNTHEIKQARRDIARIHTALSAVLIAERAAKSSSPNLDQK